MNAAGRVVEKGVEEAHHIVAQGAKAAAPAREILEKVGIGIHDAVNGAAVKVKQHAVMHTKPYYQAANNAIRAAAKDIDTDIAGAKEAVSSALTKIRESFGGR